MKDNFSTQSANYEQYRPDYPAELYEYIFGFVRGFDCAWDCATGNGQAAKELAGVFKRVEASDISRRQLDKAYQHLNIHYHLCPAESTPFKNEQFDLVTVAQALHWFDFDGFFAEVKRVLKPTGVLAVWTYGLLNINPEIDNLMIDFYRNQIGPYWDDERNYVDSQYKDINFPFEQVSKNTFFMNKHWSLSTLTGYIQTWSSVEKYKKTNGVDPVIALKDSLTNLWSKSEYKITFPLTVFVLNDH